MTKAAKISPEQIATARMLLHDLPHKETPKTPEEAAVSLAKDFRQALKKGYTVQDISELLKSAGLTIPVSAIRRRAEAQQKLSRCKTGEGGIKKKTCPHDLI